MGAKQSKRSVDISGKEGESAGEVAAAGAGGEGRVEPLADADANALKPQLNGDAHINEKSEKEKELDGGTPENEKDATTEKESKLAEENKDKEAANGEAEQKTDSEPPTPDDGKKPKKEKVKKKWSLRSISFSRKDKPKQEKKQKDEESKTNGEPEKVPEETAEATTPAVIVNDVSNDKTENDSQEKTPETPVTEPITNGSNTPESPKVEVENSVTPSPDTENSEQTKPEQKLEPEPELPMNGLSLEDKPVIPVEESKIVASVENKVEEQAVEKTPELTPTPEIPVKEVCVDQMPLIEPTPPPLPANPPPSSVASFAATTMAPELADASLPNTAETAPPVSLPTLQTEEVHTDLAIVHTDIEHVTDLTTAAIESTQNDVVTINKAEVVDNIPLVEGELEKNAAMDATPIDQSEVLDNIIPVEVPIADNESATLINEDKNDLIGDQIADTNVVDVKETVVKPQIELTNEDLPVVNGAPVEEPSSEVVVDNLLPQPEIDNLQKIDEEVNSLQTPEVPVELDQTEVNSNHKPMDTDMTDILDEEMNVQPKEKCNNAKEATEILPEMVECNGNIEEYDDNARTEFVPETTEDNSIVVKVNGSIAEEELPPPPSLEAEELPSPMDLPQEPMPVCDKMADLIPEIPTVPELKTEMLQETSTDVAVAN